MLPRMDFVLACLMTCIICLAAPVVSSGVSPAAPAKAGDTAVNVPDPNLRTELRRLTGIPADQVLYRSDLAGLTGTINLSNKNIVNAEGLQYCRSIESLYLDHNYLSSLPDGLAEMTHLQVLHMQDNEFADIPTQLFTLENLTILDMSENPISSIHTGIAGLSSLRALILENCRLIQFPAAVLALQLRVLDLSGNTFATVPSGISGMKKMVILSLRQTGLTEMPGGLSALPYLEQLDLSQNNITELPGENLRFEQLQRLDLSGNALSRLPDAIGRLPRLKELILDQNPLTRLPDAIGRSSLTVLSVYGCRLNKLPNSLGQSESLSHLELACNQLTYLPANLATRTFEFVNLDFNFIDLTPGSSASIILERLNCGTLYDKRQLKPVRGLSADAGLDSIALSWQAGENGQDGAAAWEVDRYQLYQNRDGVLDLLVESGTTAYTHKKLTPGTSYTYCARIVYHITDSVSGLDRTVSCDTTISVSTRPSAGPGTTAKEKPAPAFSVPGWPIVLTGLAGLGLIIVMIVWIKRRF
ncbi:MAG: leucine-rich repeat domain-containing protein [Clostridiaceae bacterium]|nr:leucine-rich repeat domain-containing protein [Clostridiaceae bacterium]